ncbi:MAG TPA: hypothetical protein VGJ20_09880 [Xanthobacteraceae bacterium]|jgi:hypothetical protein
MALMELVTQSHAAASHRISVIGNGAVGLRSRDHGYVRALDPAVLIG